MGSFILGQDADCAPLPPRDVLLSVRTGKSRQFGNANFRTAINKRAREGKLNVTTLGIVGDEQTFESHGGPDKALHQYCSSHYKIWNDELPDRAHLFKIGGFGENLSTAHMSEGNVCIGDIYRIGLSLIVQVTQPRQPCYKLNHRFEHKKASSLSQSSGRTGWYLRVLVPGQIEQGDDIELIERIHPQWPLSRVQKYLYHDRDNVAAMAELVGLAALADEMRDVFKNRLSRGTEDMTGRLDDQTSVVWKSYRLAAKVQLTSRISQFIFEKAQGDDDDVGNNYIARFQHVRLRFGPDLSFTRAYSVVSGDMTRFELGIAKDDKSRGGSAYLHDEMKIDAIVKVAKGHAADVILVATNEPSPRKLKHIFIIGGIGITAFLAEIKRLSNSGSSLEVHYAVRSIADAVYLDQLPAECTTVYARSEYSRLDVTRIIPKPHVQGSPVCIVYCCGSSSLLKSCRDWTTTIDYPVSKTHFEEFGDSTTGTGDPFEVEIKSTRQVFHVPREESLLSVLLDAGLEIDSSCLVGNCGTCMVDYCKGEVSHRGTALGAEQKTRSLLACVSRGKGRVILDY